MAKYSMDWYKKFLQNFIDIDSEAKSKKHDILPPQITLSNDAHHIFFGYYDLNPFDKSENKVLAINVDRELSTPKPNRLAEVGYFDLTHSKPYFIKIGQTETWNWQQGCRLQWYPSCNDSAVLYNCLVDDNYGSVVMEFKNGKINQKINHAIYQLNKSGTVGLSLNFSRLQRLRPGNGYSNLPDETINENCPKNDGIWRIDIQKNQSSLLFSLECLVKVSPHDNMRNAQHYVNQLIFNPSGDSFLFLHRWIDDTNKRHSRLFTASSNGENLNLIINTGVVSHFTWLSDDRFLVFMPVDKHRQARFVLYSIENGFMGIIGIEQLIKDGHPTFISEGKSLILDTYPDKYRNQKLLLFNIVNNKLDVIDRFYSPPIFTGELRCDLHPRPSLTSNKICIDVVSNNLRAIKVLDLSNDFLI